MLYKNGKGFSIKNNEGYAIKKQNVKGFSNTNNDKGYAIKKLYNNINKSVWKISNQLQDLLSNETLFKLRNVSNRILKPKKSKYDKIETFLSLQDMCCYLSRNGCIHDTISRAKNDLSIIFQKIGFEKNFIIKENDIQKENKYERFLNSSINEYCITNDEVKQLLSFPNLTNEDEIAEKDSCQEIGCDYNEKLSTTQLAKKSEISSQIHFKENAYKMYNKKSLTLKSGQHENVSVIENNLNKHNKSSYDEDILKVRQVSDDICFYDAHDEPLEMDEGLTFSHMNQNDDVLEDKENNLHDAEDLVSRQVFDDICPLETHDESI